MGPSGWSGPENRGKERPWTESGPLPSSLFPNGRPLNTGFEFSLSALLSPSFFLSSIYLLTFFLPSFCCVAPAINNSFSCLKQTMLSLSHLRMFAPAMPSLWTTLAITPCFLDLNLDTPSSRLVGRPLCWVLLALSVCDCPSLLRL